MTTNPVAFPKTVEIDATALAEVLAALNSAIQDDREFELTAPLFSLVFDAAGAIEPSLDNE